MGCVGGFNKNCDKCIILLREYGGLVKKNNYTIPEEKLTKEKNSNKCKKQLNEALEKMNNYAKYDYEFKQVREFNEIYQSLLDLESERNKSNLDINKNNNLYENPSIPNEII